MSFLTPLYFLGAIAVLGPILSHLIRRSAWERTTFSSLMFLSPAPPRTVRRRKLEHPMLLLLRCLCLLLIVTGFARPFFPANQPPPESTAGGRQIILLVDTSASMRRTGVWEKTRRLVEQYLAKAAPADQLAVTTFDRRIRTLVSFAEWASWPADTRPAMARQRLATISPGWMGTDLGLALTSAAEEFHDISAMAAPSKGRALVLISDLQEGARLDGLQGHDWPANVCVVIERVDGNQESNAGMEILDRSANTAGTENDIRVRVANASNSHKEKFRLDWSGVNGASADIYLLPGESRTFAAPKLPAGTMSGKLELSGDDVEFDNVSYFAAPEVENVAIACLGMEPVADPAGLLYYLQRVFPPTPRRNVQLVPAESLPSAAFAVISGNLAPQKCGAVHDWLAGGKSALLVLNDAKAASTLAALLGLPQVQLCDANGDFVLLGRIDFKSPIFAPFDDPRFSDFSHIHFWKHRRWEIPSTIKANVLAEFDDGSPALAQVPVGKGQLLVLASGWNPADSQLAVSSKFPPLMQTMLEWSGSTEPTHFQFHTGDAIPSPIASGAAIQWQNPDGKEITLAAGAEFIETDAPGIYQVRWGKRTRQFAVNLPADESRTAPMPMDRLARLGVPIGPLAAAPTLPSPAGQRAMERSELESRQKIWRWLLTAALAITVLEMIVSGWLARRATAQQAAI